MSTIQPSILFKIVKIILLINILNWVLFQTSQRHQNYGTDKWCSPTFMSKALFIIHDVQYGNK